MALTYCTLKIIAPHMKAANILSLGYPDLLLTKSQVIEIFGVEPDKFTSHGAWHGVKEPIPETEDLLRLVGSTLECVDISAARGNEKIADLNVPQDLGKYDLVIDAGTTEHCFNIGQAMLNAANAVKVGGRIFHTPPVTMLNHGFYCIQPTMLHDFYVQNGWEIESMNLIIEGKLHDCPRTQRFRAPLEMSVCCLAKRLTDMPLVFPVQTKYLKNPTL